MDVLTNTGEPVSETLAERIAQARAEAGERLRAGADGVEIAKRLTEDFEAPVVELITEVLEKHGFGDGSGLVVVATGGFGREEFAPYSDLDLVFLSAHAPDDCVARAAEAVLHPLWDARLDAGHAVRSVAHAFELPETDLTSATAMLEARYLAGDRALLEMFSRDYATKVSHVNPEGLIPRLRHEQESRHRKFGDTIYLLEPDLKSGPGGIRDLCVGRWAARARFGTGSARELAARGEMSERQSEAFEAARSWLLRARIACHLQAGRHQDQLRFDIQERIAPWMYPEVTDDPGRVRSDVAPAVEALMRDYQVHANTISRETERLLERASADPNRDPTSIPITLQSGCGSVDESFVLKEGALEAFAPEVFRKNPSEAVRIFCAAIELDVPVGLDALDAIADLCAAHAEALRNDPAAIALFFEVLTDNGDAANPSRLETMADVGLITAFIPEWAPCVGRVQHDVYHVYTVDRHQLYTVAALKALARREYVDEHPLPTEQIALVRSPLPLYLAALIHDIGKPLGPNHPVNGSQVAATIAERLGMSDDDQEVVSFLVKEHLTLGLVSQRRDLADKATIAQTAELCLDEESLVQLYLITFCDLQSIGPGNLTNWKEDLLREIFLRTMAYVRHGSGHVEANVLDRVKERRRQAGRALCETFDADIVRELLESFPNRYFVENSAARILAHARLILSRKGPCAIEFNHFPRREYTEMVIVADDMPGLLATVTGVLYANRIDILDAAIYTRQRGQGARPEAVDVFRIRRAFAGAVMEESRLESIVTDMTAALGGATTAATLVAKRPQNSGLFERAKPTVPPTEVLLDNEFSPEHTILDIFTEDRPGILYAITDILRKANIDIKRSKVGMEADRAADIFYILDGETGAPITDPIRLDQLVQALKDTLPSWGK